MKVSVIFLMLVCIVTAQNKNHFTVLELEVDSGKHSLAAYQIELKYGDQLKIISIEGGEKAFSVAPNYQKKKPVESRLILAAFNLNDSMAPKGRTIVCRIHIMYRGDEIPKIDLSLMAAAKVGGQRIPLKMRLKNKPSEGL